MHITDDALASLAASQSPVIGAASRLVPARHDTPELLDLGTESPEDTRQNLDDLWRINRCLGGVAAFARHLYPRLRTVPEAATVADLGAGSGHVAGQIAQWARQRGLNVRVLALDLSARHLAIGQQQTGSIPTLHRLQADAARLPFAPGSVDYVISSLFLHHFTPEQVVALLRTSFAVARRGVIMNDLVRGWLPLAGFRLIQPVFARSFITRHDGAVSVRRAYTPPELRRLAAAAGLANAHVHADLFWRMTLVADK